MACATSTSTPDIVAVRAAIFPTDNGDGQILIFGNTRPDAIDDPTQRSEIGRINCRTPTETRPHTAHPRLNAAIFGQAFLGDGRLLLAGGTPDVSGAGLAKNRLVAGGERRKCETCTATSSFADAADLKPDRDGRGEVRGERQLTLCTLGTGEILALDGTSGREPGAERYQPLADRWVQLPKARRQPSDANRRLHCHLLADGDVFIASPFVNNSYCTKLDPWTGIAHPQAEYLPDPGYWDGSLPSVLLPLVPGNNYTPRILLCGQHPSQLLDFNYPSWHWQSVPRTGAMASTRRLGSCATLLPTGQVLLTGGTAAASSQPELYDPPFNAACQQHDYGVGSWKTLQGAAT
ncbi:hypothetical protein DL771_006602 [Monosporascus sp. 5C6A]|nr:hypothetical protein DL771_006602 [Monosporascus sp. 5C6A]